MRLLEDPRVAIDFMLEVSVLSPASHADGSGVAVSSAVTTVTPAAPGTLASHYAPRARVRLMTIEQMRAHLHDAKLPLATWTRTSLLSVEQAALPDGVKHFPMPSDAAQCAHDLFAQLRSMDALGVQEIWIETPPDGEAWEGVKDRLKRAAALRHGQINWDLTPIVFRGPKGKW